MLFHAIITAVSLGYAVGVWEKGSLSNELFRPDFFLQKLGTFSQRGSLRILRPTAEIKSLCLSHRTEAWITHRLSFSETLGEKSAVQLATHLNQLDKCIQAVELDIEPMAFPPPWLETFMKELRHAVRPDLEIRLAIPVVTRSPISELYWTPEQMARVLKLADGLDVMVYDTGVKQASRYREMLTELLADVGSMLKASPSKSVVMGLPAYYDKTERHLADVENLANAVSAIKAVASDLACLRQVRYAVYAGWTMTEVDRRIAHELAKWIDNGCRT